MEDGRLETGETGNTRETGEWLQERLVTGETGGMGRQEVGDRRREMGDRRWKKIDRRRFSDNISEKFSADNLAGEIINF